MTNNLISKDIQLIIESYILDDKTISVDLDKFESGECNKLIISGLSGAGKTTLGKSLAEKYNCKVIDTDDIYHELLDKYPNNLNKVYYLADQQLLKLLKDKSKYIISGVGIAAAYKHEPEITNLILKLPFIFLGKSMLRSSWDAGRREYREKEKTDDFTLLNSIFYATLYNFRTFYKSETRIKLARIAIENSIVKDFIVK